MRNFLFLLPLLFLSACTMTMHNLPKNDLIETVGEVRRDHGLEKSEPILAKPFRQAWLEHPEKEFEPAHAELHAGEDSFMVVAVLSDRDIHNSATGFNEPTWQTGDVFEIFIQTDDDTYYEFHVTPENRNLFLAWTPESFTALRRGEVTLEDAMIQDRNFLSSETHIQEAKNHWTVFARIPYANLGIDPANPPADLKVGFARYDTSRGEDSPVLSATPDFPKASYHLREFWHPVELKPL